ncbi:MAG TPA: helix-turn-helix transcriptional regulator [Candidatus Dormibacteraeota bacterium]
MPGRCLSAPPRCRCRARRSPGDSRDAMGATPIQHLTRFRMARAAQYLRETDAGIREIARLTGYDSEVSISKAFRLQFGVAPGAYRRGR